MEKEIENQISINDILIKGLSDEIIKKVKDYLKKNNIKEDDVRINIEIINTKNPYLMKIQTTIYRRDKWK